MWEAWCFISKLPQKSTSSHSLGLKWGKHEEKAWTWTWHNMLKTHTVRTTRKEPEWTWSLLNTCLWCASDVLVIVCSQDHEGSNHATSRSLWKRYSAFAVVRKLLWEELESKQTTACSAVSLGLAMTLRGSICVGVLAAGDKSWLCVYCNAGGNALTHSLTSVLSAFLMHFTRPLYQII